MAKASETPDLKAEFIEPMECLAVERIPEGTRWTYEIKLVRYRLEVVRAGGSVTLFSRNKKVLTQDFPQVAAELKSLPDGTVIMVNSAHSMRTLGQVSPCCRTTVRRNPRLSFSRLTS